VIEKALMDKEGVNPERAKIISQMAGGNYHRALVLLEDESILQREDVLVFFRAAYSGKPMEIHNIVLKMTQRRSVNEIDEALRSMLNFLHDAWTLQQNEGCDSLAFADYRDTLVKFSKTLSYDDIGQCIIQVEEAIADIKGNVIPALVLLTLALDIHRLFHNKTPKLMST
jgi:hypothetical protein